MPHKIALSLAYVKKKTYLCSVFDKVQNTIYPLSLGRGCPERIGMCANVARTDRRSAGRDEGTIQVISNHAVVRSLSLSNGMHIGITEIIIIALIVLLLFGGKKIPELMKGLGKGVKSFKDGMKEGDEEEKKAS